MHDPGYLREAAEDASEHPGWDDFADYFRLLHDGLRDEALSTLDLFIDQARFWPLAERIAFVVWLAERRQAYRGQPEAVMPASLFRQLVKPTLEQWALEASADPWPLVWLARLSSGGSTWHDPPEPFLYKALERDPDFPPARIDLIEAVLATIRFTQHELPYAYVGDAAEDLARLDDIEPLLLGLDLDVSEPLRLLIAHARHDARAWLARGGL